MTLELLWDPDFALLLAESTPWPGGIFFHFLMKYMDLLKIKLTKTVLKKRKSDDESAPGLTKKCCFAAPLTEKQIADCCQPLVLKNTQRNTSWGVGAFKDWCSSHNKQSPQKCPEDLLSAPHPTGVFDYWLATFGSALKLQLQNALNNCVFSLCYSWYLANFWYIYSHLFNYLIKFSLTEYHYSIHYLTTKFVHITSQLYHGWHDITITYTMA